MIESSFLGVPTAILRAEAREIEALYQEQYRGHLAFIKNFYDFNDWIHKLEVRRKIGDSWVFEEHTRRMKNFLNSLHWFGSESGRASI